MTWLVFIIFAFLAIISALDYMVNYKNGSLAIFTLCAIVIVFALNVKV